MLQSYRYNSEKGPLWCARLLQDTKPDKYAIDEGFPSTSQLFLGIHHGIADGITVLMILGGFIKILEDVIAGNPVSDNEEIGHFISDTENERLVTAKMNIIQNDPSLMQELSAFKMDKGIGMPLLLSVIPSPKEGEDKTHSLTRVFERNITRRFINRCKDEGVTVHSAFTAITNVSTIQLLIENGFIKDSYRLCNRHVVNLRRFWPGHISGAMGCHAHFPLRLWMDTPKDMLKNNFWDIARNLHSDLHYHLKEETLLLRAAFSLLKFQDTNYDDIPSTADTVQSEGGLSNLGDVTALLTEGGRHVKPYLLKRRISIHGTAITDLNFFFQTFRGRFILDLIYNTRLYASDTVKKLCDQIFHILEEVIEK